MKKYFYLGFLFIASCSDRIAKCSISQQELQDFTKKSSSQLIKIGKYQCRNKNDSFHAVKGGYYDFYPNGYLKSYNFIISGNVSTYAEQFNADGMLMFQTKNTILHRIAELQGDSLTITFILFSLKKSIPKSFLS